MPVKPPKINQSHIAKKFGIDRSTVSLCFSNPSKVKPDTLEAVLAYAKECGYKPNAGARMMRSSHTSQLGVLVCNGAGDTFAHPMQYETILGITDACEANDYLITVLRINDVINRLQENSRAFHEQRLDGLIVAGFMPKSVTKQIKDCGITTLWLDSNTWRKQSCARRDEHEAGRLTIKACHEAGHDTVTWLGVAETTKQKHYSYDERIAGAREYAEEHKITLIEKSLPATQIDYEAIFAKNPTLVAESYYMARHLLTEGMKLGQCPGIHYALACPDSGADADRFWPQLSRASFDRYGMGHWAAESLIDHVKTNKTIKSKTFTTTWIDGNTLSTQA